MATSGIDFEGLGRMNPEGIFARLSLIGSLTGNVLMHDSLGMEMVGVELANLVGQSPWQRPPTTTQVAAHVLKSVIDEALRVRLGDPGVRAVRWRKQLEALRLMSVTGNVKKADADAGGRKGVIAEMVREGYVEDRGRSGYQITPVGRHHLGRLEEWGEQTA